MTRVGVYGRAETLVRSLGRPRLLSMFRSKDGDLAAPGVEQPRAPATAPRTNRAGERPSRARWLRGRLVRRRGRRVLRTAAVEHVWVEVEPVRPDDRAQLRIDAHLPEVGRIAEGLAHRTPEVLGQVNDALAAVIEGQAERLVGERLDGGDGNHESDATAAGRCRPAAHGRGRGPNWRGGADKTTDGTTECNSVEALTGSDPAAPHLRFARRASKCSSAGLDIGRLPRPPGACRRTRCGRTRPVHAGARHAMLGTGYRSSRDHAASVWVDKTSVVSLD
jgi:hypothetical protein